jgi:SEC-C motif-containing protein
VRALGDYLMDTWHPSTRPPEIRRARDCAGSGSEVNGSRPMTATGARSVEFVARSKLGGRAQRLHESEPLRARGRPLVLLDALPDAAQPKRTA